MRSPEECLQQAEECDRLAAAANNATHRQLLADAAVEWRKLAEGARDIMAMKQVLAKSD